MKTKRILLHLAILALAIVSIASGSYGIYHLRYYDSKENCLHRYTESYASVTSGVIEEIVDNRIYRENFMDPNKVVAKAYKLKTIKVSDIVKIAKSEEKLSFYAIMAENTKEELKYNSSARKKEEYEYYKKIADTANLYFSIVDGCDALNELGNKSKKEQDKALTRIDDEYILSENVEFQATYVLNGKTYKFTNQEKDQTISEENKYMDIVTSNSKGATLVANNYLQEESYKSLFKEYFPTYDDDLHTNSLNDSKFTVKIGFKRNDKDGFSLEHELIKAEKALSAKEISAQKRLCITGLVICVACMLLSLIPFIMLLIIAGHKRKGDIPYTNKFDKIWADVLTVIMIMVGISMAMSICEGAFQNPMSGLTGVIGYVVLCGFFCLIYIEVFIQCAESFARRIKSRMLIKSTLLYWIYSKIKIIILGFINNGKMWAKVTAAGIVCLVWNIIAFLFVQSYGYWGMLFFWIIPILLVCKYLIKYFEEKEQIINEAEKITEGEVDHKITGTFKYPSNRKLKDTINNIGDGIENAVTENMKSERMKTDLITNVSHDLKTPLTSIINYVDLLKTEGVDSKNANKYLDILDKKSQRLKNLTEDLVEASKLTSGAIELHKEKINIVELINQSLGEYNEKFNQRNLTIVKTIPDKAIYINADGRRMWRVFENLYGNIFKYAMEGTRVYVDVEEHNGEIVIGIKNISEKALNISPDELMDRFVRGDQSRSTEGSGLGLSIAKTIIERHDGTMEIILDGDLFKVVIAIK